MRRDADEGRLGLVASASLTLRSIDRSVRREPTARTQYQRLRAEGMDPVAAGNLTALLNGLAPVAGGWNLDEVERLLFTRHLFERGRLRS